MPYQYDLGRVSPIKVLTDPPGIKSVYLDDNTSK